MFTTKVKPHHFFVLIPNIFGFKGGIQVYSRFLLQALQDLYPDANYDVFLKYDRYATTSMFSVRTRFHCLGKWTRLVQSLLLALKTIGLGIC
ncbi:MULTISPECIES: hypothetical protein [unclassified Coleofasciculus]|uniref:hypothetical protein n=1 Tax=unclassified Coleofasciculus TaxID=2692782 RepID=UPI001D13B072|nr:MULTISPECIES: hypothetical protein [unclassified Coleofasciculus]